MKTILVRIDLVGAGQVEAGDLAYGDQKRLEIGLALGGDPKLLPL